MKYRVRAIKSSYYGRTFEALDKEKVQKDVGNSLGRTDQWYESWDVILDTNEGVGGAGFKYSELELVEGLVQEEIKTETISI